MHRANRVSEAIDILTVSDIILTCAISRKLFYSEYALYRKRNTRPIIVSRDTFSRDISPKERITNRRPRRGIFDFYDIIRVIAVIIVLAKANPEDGGCGALSSRFFRDDTTALTKVPTGRRLTIGLVPVGRSGRAEPIKA